jgi:hypothetical protein
MPPLTEQWASAVSPASARAWWLGVKARSSSLHERQRECAAVPKVVKVWTADAISEQVKGRDALTVEEVGVLVALDGRAGDERERGDSDIEGVGGLHLGSWGRDVV